MPGAHYNNIELFRKLHQKKAKDSQAAKETARSWFWEGPGFQPRR
jgi:hypothetical protein